MFALRSDQIARVITIVLGLFAYQKPAVKCIDGFKVLLGGCGYFNIPYLLRLSWSVILSVQFSYFTGFSPYLKKMPLKVATIFSMQCYALRHEKS